MLKNSLYKIGSERIIKGVGRMSNLVIDRAQGSYVHDMISDKEYLDFTSGIAVTSTGHCHPKVVKAIQTQAGKLLHAQANIHLHEGIVELTEELNSIMPNPELNSYFFTNSGAEAIENSIKLARNINNKKNIIVFQGGYHGRTFGTMALTTSKTIYSKGFGPFMQGIYTAPYPYPYQIFNRFDTTEEEAINYSIHQFELLLKQTISPDDVSAVLIEPILGEGGYISAPKEFLLKLKEICKKNNILLIADEVQSGFCRTGKWFAIQHSDDNLPDIMVMAKGIASGLPISAVVTNKKYSDVQAPGSMGGTYAGNPIACSAAIATIKVLKEENILNNVNTRADYIFGRLNSELPKILEPYGYQVSIRGKGLMIGIEFYHPDKRDSKLATKISQYCLNHLDMLIMTTSVFDTLRLMPALILSESEAETAINKLLLAAEESLKTEK